MSSNYYWGIDIGGTRVKLGLVNTDGDVLVSSVIDTLVENGPDDLVDRIAQTCKGLLLTEKIPSDMVRAFGVGSPGPMSQNKGTLLDPGNLPGFENYPIRDRLAQLLERPGVLENDVNAICWAEFKFGAGRDVETMVMLALGTGVGGGIIYQSELIQGAKGNGAELGHMIVVDQGRECKCGQQGCLESYASASHVVKRTKEKLDLGLDSTLKEVINENHHLTCEAIFEHAEDGDDVAVDIVNSVARTLAQTAVNLDHIFEPELCVLGGGVSKSGEFLLSQVREHYHDMMWDLNPATMEFAITELDDHAGVLGSAALCFDKF